MRRDDLNGFLAFIAVAREGSFTKAAAKLGVSQSALSYTVRTLEARARPPFADPHDAQRLPDRGWRAFAKPNRAAVRSHQRAARQAGRLNATRPRTRTLTVAMIRQAALDGTGLAYIPDDLVDAAIQDGRLVRMLADWCPPRPGYHLYYPSRRQPSPAFALVVDALRHRA